jgi:phage/plasmid-like protein (TIGR03299 family)
MGHNLNLVKGKHSFYSRKEVAWHGLGQVVEEAQNSEEAIKLAGLDYDVTKVPVFANFRDLPQTLDANGKPIKGAIVPDYYATVRNDTKDILGLVGNRYEVVQNQQAFDFIDGIVGSKEAIFETAGALGKGEKVFVTAVLPDTIRIKQTDDIIKKYLMFYASHDGSSPVIAGFTPVRIVCNNTLNMALKDIQNKVSIRHTKSVHDKLETGRELLGLYRVYSREFAEVMNFIAEKPIVQETVDLVLGELIFTNSEKKIIENDCVYNEEISTRKRNMFLDMVNYVDAGVGQELHRGTGLWLFNGISSYYNNEKNYKEDEDRFQNLFSGTSYAKTQKALDLILDLS